LSPCSGAFGICAVCRRAWNCPAVATVRCPRSARRGARWKVSGGVRQPPVLCRLVVWRWYTPVGRCSLRAATVQVRCKQSACGGCLCPCKRSAVQTQERAVKANRVRTNGSSSSVRAVQAPPASAGAVIEGRPEEPRRGRCVPGGVPATRRRIRRSRGNGGVRRAFGASEGTGRKQRMLVCFVKNPSRR